MKVGGITFPIMDSPCDQCCPHSERRCAKIDFVIEMVIGMFDSEHKSGDSKDR